MNNEEYARFIAGIPTQDDSHPARIARERAPKPLAPPLKKISAATPEGLEITRKLEQAFAEKNLELPAEELGQFWHRVTDAETNDEELTKAAIVRAVNKGIAERKKPQLNPIIDAVREKTPIQKAGDLLQAMLGRQPKPAELRAFLDARSGGDVRGHAVAQMNAHFSKK